MVFMSQCNLIFTISLVYTFKRFSKALVIVVPVPLYFNGCAACASHPIRQNNIKCQSHCCVEFIVLSVLLQLIITCVHFAVTCVGICQCLGLFELDAVVQNVMVTIQYLFFFLLSIVTISNYYYPHETLPGMLSTFIFDLVSVFPVIDPPK